MIEAPKILYVPICNLSVGKDADLPISFQITPEVRITSILSPKKKFYVNSFFNDNQAAWCRDNAKDANFELVLELKDGKAPFKAAHTILFLLSIRCLTTIYAPFWSNASINNWHLMPNHSIHTEKFEQLEIGALSTSSDLKLSDLLWVRNSYINFENLFQKNRFRIAVQALNSFSRVQFIDFSVLSAWIALEALFKIESEISFRLSYTISRYLEKEIDYEKFKKIKKSYDFRSRIAHGGDTGNSDSYKEATFVYLLLCNCLRKVIESGELPDEKKILFD